MKKDKNNLINSDKIKSDPLVTKMISLLMRHGKRSKAEKVLSKTFLFLDKDYPGQSIDIFYTAIINARQDIAVRLKPKSKKKTRRNKHSYDVYIPRVILPICGINLGIRSILKASRERSKFSFLPLWESLSQELFEASQNKGKVIENRFKVNSLAVSNKGKVRFSIRG